MKTLVLFRHAKAGQAGPGLGDYERALTPRGTEAAARMGRAMAGLGLSPDLVLCSKARRARETWDLAAPELAGTPRVEIGRALYLAAPGALLDAVQGADFADDGTDIAAGTVLVVGHNPGLEWLAGALSGPDSDPGALKGLAGSFPTAGLAVLTFETASWLDIHPGQGRLTHFLRPRKTP